MKTIKLILISFATIALVAGCGGGGSSGSSAPVASKVSINAGNADAVAKGGMSNSQSMAKTGAVGAGTVGVVVEPGIPKQSVMQIALAQLKLLQNTKLPVPPAGSVGASIAPWPITFGCGIYSNTNSYNAAPVNTANGTLTIDFQDNNNDGVFGVTDVASMSFSSCKTDNPAKSGSTITTNGTMSLTINTHNGVTTPSVSTPLSESVTMSFAGFSSVDTAPTTPETITMDGGITMSVTDDGTQLTAQMSGSSFSSTSTSDGAFTMKNFLISYSENISTTAYSFTVSMTTSCAALNGDIVITTPTAFTGTGTGNPTAGVMRIDGASNSYITITANPDGNTVTIVANDGTQTVVTKTVGWDQV